MPTPPLPSYGAEGPLGFPLSDRQARNLDTLLKTMPKGKEFEYRKTVFPKAPTELHEEKPEIKNDKEPFPS